MAAYVYSLSHKAPRPERSGPAGTEGRTHVRPFRPSSDYEPAMTTNRLGAATSAYLQSAAHQPIHWYPWGERRSRRARARTSPVLLDIGAVWCHWCHVMDGESTRIPRWPNS